MENKGFQSCKCETTDESETRGDCKAQVWQRLARFLQLCVCACIEREREREQAGVAQGWFFLARACQHMYICDRLCVHACAAGLSFSTTPLMNDDVDRR
jgi:hypothetical protein